MIDEDEKRFAIIDRFTPEELIEALGVTVEEVFERFRDECLELDLNDVWS